MRSAQKDRVILVKKPYGFFTNNLVKVEKLIIESVAKGKKGVICDFDGVIANNYASRSKIYHKAFCEYGFDVPLDRVMGLYCEMGGREIFKKIAHEQGKDGKIIELLKRYAYGMINERVRDVDFSRLINVIPIVKAKRAQTGIATNCHGGWDLIVDNLCLNEYFDYIVTANDYKSKPSPEMLNAMLELMKLKPSEAIFIGDRKSDEDAGKAANVATYRVCWEYHPKAA